MFDTGGIIDVLKLFPYISFHLNIYALKIESLLFLVLPALLMDLVLLFIWYWITHLTYVSISFELWKDDALLWT